MRTTATHARENEVTILARVFGKERGMLSEEMARHILDLGFSDRDRARMHDLIVGLINSPSGRASPPAPEVDRCLELPWPPRPGRTRGPRGGPSRGGYDSVTIPFHAASVIARACTLRGGVSDQSVRRVGTPLISRGARQGVGLQYH